ncbi:MAG: hypothetical protein M0R17_04410 [Candidatus Omnitrophica bacterium]|nr:hypothetical protein [Candidatus Omnitrophota bacterium]
MKKNLRSVTRNSEGIYEYFRLDAEEAIKLVDAKTHIFISKEEYKRQSKFYTLYPCPGTLINVEPFEDKDGNLITQKYLDNINYTKHLGEQFPSSTKIAKCSSSVSKVIRRNKYAIKPNTILKRNRKAKREIKIKKLNDIKD